MAGGGRRTVNFQANSLEYSTVKGEEYSTVNIRQYFKFMPFGTPFTLRFSGTKAVKLYFAALLYSIAR